MSVSSKPHVILAHEELQGYASEPGEEGGVARSQDTDHVPEHDEAGDLRARRICGGDKKIIIEKWREMYVRWKKELMRWEMTEREGCVVRKRT